MVPAVAGRSVVAVVCVVLLAAGWWLWRGAGSGENVPADPVESFLARHWLKPLAAQGMPPAGFTDAEASLAPADCGQCHVEQLRDWRSSLHSHTMGNGMLWQARALSSDQVARCLDCHAPLAEQKALLAQALGWPEAPAAAAPAYVPPDLHRQGLVCAACHVRAHVRYGPPPSAGKPAGDTPDLPHAGFRETQAFQDSRFCATCHQFPDDGPALNGKLLENTYSEWRASRHAAEGRTCQSCHMPARRHLWRGIHDPDMVRQALTAVLSVTPAANGRLQVRAQIRNSGAGHYFPTYLVSSVRLRLVAENASGTQTRPLAEALITRDTDVWLTEERTDSRLAPDAERVLEADMQMPQEPGWRIALHIDVAPREHYERMFAAVLNDSGVQLDAVTRQMLAAALAEARASRYSLPVAQRNLPQTIAN